MVGWPGKGTLRREDVLGPCGRAGRHLWSRVVGGSRQGVPQEGKQSAGQQLGRWPGVGVQTSRVGDRSLWLLPGSSSPGAGCGCSLCCFATICIPWEGVAVPVVEPGAGLWETNAVGPGAPGSWCSL